MKKSLKNLVVVLIVAASAAFAGCGGQQAEAPSEDTGAEVEQEAEGGDAEQSAEGGEPFAIGTIQFVEHAALDAAYEGFVSALADEGYVDGENIALDFQNAQGDTNNLSTISDRFVNNNVDMVLAIATPAAQAIAGKTTEIPILATAVTSFEAAGLVESNDAPGGNISGTSDMNPVAAQIGLISELFPEAQVVGLIYNSSEDNSVLQIDLAKQEIEAKGLEYVETTVTNANDVQQAMQQLVTKCDVIYIPTDNIMASAMPTVSAVAIEAGIPTICGEANMVENGGLVTMGINYYDLGYATGLMAVEVINGKNPGEMPVQFAENSDEIVINGTTAAEMGFEIPEEFLEFVIE